MAMPLRERGHLARRVPLGGLEARAPRHGKHGDEAARRLWCDDTVYCDARWTMKHGKWRVGGQRLAVERD